MSLLLDSATAAKQKFPNVNDRKKNLLLYFFREDCPHCQVFAPVFDAFVKDLSTNTGMPVVVIYRVTNDAVPVVLEKVPFNLEGVPTVLLVRASDGKTIELKSRASAAALKQEFSALLLTVAAKSKTAGGVHLIIYTFNPKQAGDLLHQLVTQGLKVLYPPETKTKTEEGEEKPTIQIKLTHSLRNHVKLEVDGRVYRRNQAADYIRRRMISS